MATDTGVILALTEQHRNGIAARIVLSDAESVIDGLKVFIAHTELVHDKPERYKMRAAPNNLEIGDMDHWQMGGGYAEERVEEELTNSDFACVRYKLWFINAPGDVVQTTKSSATVLVDYGIADEIAEEEAAEYGRKQRLSNGGWMDEPAWVRFSTNLKRLCRAERCRAA